MNPGITLPDLVNQVAAETRSRRDLVGPARSLRLATSPKGESIQAFLEGLNGNSYGIRPHAHGQLSTYLGIPKSYYDKMLKEEPELLTTNVNRWLEKSEDRRMFRVTQNSLRAVLSDRYRPRDNLELMESILPHLSDSGLQLVSCNLTETRMYIQAVSTRITGEVTVGDTVQAGITISNSEVGAGMTRVEPLIYRLVCLNGMIMTDRSLRSRHIGRKTQGYGDDETTSDWYKDDTLRAEDDAFFLKVRDTVDGVLSEVSFHRTVANLRRSTEQALNDPLVEVEKLSDRFGLSEEERAQALMNLVNGGSLTQWGLANAVTALANNATDYDRAVDLQKWGGEIIASPQRN